MLKSLNHFNVQLSFYRNNPWLRELINLFTFLLKLTTYCHLRVSVYTETILMEFILPIYSAYRIWPLVLFLVLSSIQLRLLHYTFYIIHIYLSLPVQTMKTD